MNWLLIVIASYLFLAVANLTDKLVVSKYKSKPAVYTFFVGFLGVLGLLLIPFGFHIPTLWQIFLNLSTGIIFIVALYLLYSALYHGEASRVVTTIGALSPIFVFVFSLLILGEKLNLIEMAAFGFLLVGGFLMIGDKGSSKHSRQAVILTILAALVFGIYYTLSKLIYTGQEFLSSFIWMRIGGFIAVLAILLLPANRKAVADNLKHGEKGTGGMVIFGQACGALGFLFLNYAISKASSVAIVNALQGVQYTILFILVIILAKKFPQLNEDLSRKIIIKKVLAILVIAIGIIILAIK